MSIVSGSLLLVADPALDDGPGAAALRPLPLEGVPPVTERRTLARSTWNTDREERPEHPKLQPSGMREHLRSSRVKMARAARTRPPIRFCRDATQSAPSSWTVPRGTNSATRANGRPRGLETGCTRRSAMPRRGELKKGLTATRLRDAREATVPRGTNQPTQRSSAP